MLNSIYPPTQPLARLTERGQIEVSLPGDGFTPAALETATKLIPGRRHLPGGGWTWGYSAEVLERLRRDLGVTLDMPTAAYLEFVRGLPASDPSQRTPVRPVEPLAWRAATEPRQHQVEFKWWRRGGGLDHRLHHNALLEAGKGTGKTLSAIEEMLELLSHYPQARILVLARNSNLRTVWAEQIDEHAAGLPYTILSGPRSKRLEMLGQRMQIGPMVYVHNHEDLPTMGAVLADLTWDLVVVDESSRFRTAAAARTRLLTGASRKQLRAETRLALSGAPVIKRTVDAYPVLKWLGAPVGNKAEFTERFLVMDPDGRTELAIKDVAGLNQLLDAYRFVVPKGTVLNLPRAWHYERVSLAPWQRESYRRVQRELRTRFVGPEGHVQERLVVNRLGELLRLTQVAAGFEAIDTEHYNWRDDNAKTRHLLSNVLPDFEGEPLVIWAHYRPEIENLARLVASAGRRPVKFYGGHPGTASQVEAANDAAYADFKAGRADTFIANTEKGAHGLNLPQAWTMIYYTRTYDTEAWQQSLDRNSRLSTDPEALLNVIVLVAEDTSDDHVTRVLGDDMRRAAQITSLDVASMLGLPA